MPFEDALVEGDRRVAELLAMPPGEGENDQHPGEHGRQREGERTAPPPCRRRRSRARVVESRSQLRPVPPPLNRRRFRKRALQLTHHALEGGQPVAALAARLHVRGHALALGRAQLAAQIRYELAFRMSGHGVRFLLPSFPRSVSAP